MRRLLFETCQGLRDFCLHRHASVLINLDSKLGLLLFGYCLSFPWLLQQVTTVSGIKKIINYVFIAVKIKNLKSRSWQVAFFLETSGESVSFPLQASICHLHTFACVPCLHLQSSPLQFMVP